MAREQAQLENGSGSGTPDSERAKKRIRLSDAKERNSTPALPEMIVNTICSIVGSLPAGRLEDMDPSPMYALYPCLIMTCSDP